MTTITPLPRAEERSGTSAPRPAATWISVDDDLPLQREIVLVCNVLDQQIFCACREAADRWRLSEGDADGILTVTHWMPLPAPPPLSK